MRFGKDIVLISKHFRRQRNRYMEPFGLKGIHARLLVTICDHPGISQDKLAQWLSIDKSTVARQVAVLEEGAYLLRTPSAEDKRVLCLTPTQKTVELLPGLQQEMDRYEEKLLGALNDEERKLFLSFLSRICADAEKEDLA